MQFGHRLCGVVVAGCVMGVTIGAAAEGIWSVTGGESRLHVNTAALDQYGVMLLADDQQAADFGELPLAISHLSDFTFAESDGSPAGQIRHEQGFTLVGSTGRQVAIAGFAMRSSGSDVLAVTAGGDSGGTALLEVQDIKISFDRWAQEYLVEGGQVVVTPALAEALDTSGLAGVSIGLLLIRAEADDRGTSQDPGEDNPVEIGGNNGTICNNPVGPDVIVGSLPNLSNYGAVSGISAFAVGTTSCNIGNQNLSWIAGNNQHPVIAQNMYRLANGRFEQVGMSWLKHGFTALTGNICGCGCSGQGGSVLGVGCSDPYSSGLNGSQGGLGPRSQVNAFTGQFSYPFGSQGATGNAIYKRLQVRNADFAAGGQFYVEGHYIAPDDATAGNGLNNMSYARVTPEVDGSSYDISLAGPTIRETPAIYAWPAADPTVNIKQVGIPGEGLLITASQVYDLGGGQWEYEYAIMNINSDRSVGSVTVPLIAGTTVSSTGFHDVDYHSGEPYSGTDWTPTVSGSSVSWATQPFGTNPNANAIRWSTMYNFRFIANAPPTIGGVTLGLFKPGTPGSVIAPLHVPQAAVVSAQIEAGFCCATHDTAGEFCLDMDGGAIEPRTPGVQNMRFDLDQNVVNVSASVACGSGYGGTVTATVLPGGGSVEVEFAPSLPDADCCTVTLTGDASDTFQVRTLSGDVDQNESTNAADITAIKPFLGIAVDGSNFLIDIDANGNINAADITAVKPLLGGAAANCP